MDEVKEEKKENVATSDKKFEQVKPAEKEGKKPEKEKPKKEKKPKVRKEKTPKEAKEKGKKRGILARTIAVIIVLCLVIGLIYLALPSPARVLEQMLRDLKAGNFEQAQQYVDYKQLSDIPALGASEENTENEAVNENDKLFYENLQWKIKNIEKNGDEAKIEVEITNKNYKTIFQNYTKKIIQKLFNNESTSTEEMEQYLIEEFKNENVDQVTTTQTITVQKQDGKWKVVVDESLRNAIYPGLTEAIEALTNLE